MSSRNARGSRISGSCSQQRVSSSSGRGLGERRRIADDKLRELFRGGLNDGLQAPDAAGPGTDAGRAGRGR